MSNLTSGEWAAWVQAIGSIVAIISAAGIAIWQSNKQHQSALKLHEEEQRYSRLETAKTLAVLTTNSYKTVCHFMQQLSSREEIHNYADGTKYLDIGQLVYLEKTLESIPLYSLPSSLVSHSMILNGIVRQFRYKVEVALRDHRGMNADDFSDLFKVFGEMEKSLSLTCKDIEQEVTKVQKKA